MAVLSPGRAAWTPLRQAYEGLKPGVPVARLAGVALTEASGPRPSEELMGLPLDCP